MPKIQKNKIEQCTKIFIYRDLKFPINCECGGIVGNYIFRIPFRENTLAFLLMSNRRLNSVHRKSASTRGHLRQYHVSIFVMKNLDPRFDYIFCHK